MSLTPTSSNATNTPPTPPLSSVVVCRVRTRLPSRKANNLHLLLYQSLLDQKEHLAIVKGDFYSATLDAPVEGETEQDRLIKGSKGCKAALLPIESDSVLVRVHSECFTGEVLGSTRCDCGEQLDTALARIEQAGRGILIYLKQEGRGIGLLDKLRYSPSFNRVVSLSVWGDRAYNLQDLGHDTVTANQLLHRPIDARSYEVAAFMLQDLGVSHCQLLTNNPEKVEQLQEWNVQVTRRIPMIPLSWNLSSSSSHSEQQQQQQHSELDRYLLTKVFRMGHLIPLPSTYETEK